VPVASGNSQLVGGITLILFWNAYNLLVIGIALLILLDIPNPDKHKWFDLKRVVCLTVENEKFWGVTTMISEGGVEVALTQNFMPNRVEKMPVKLKIMEEELELTGQITSLSFVAEVPYLRVAFDPVNLPEKRRLVEMLFCRPGQWKRQNTPGELRSLWLLLKALIKPKGLFNRKPKISAIAISQV
jgi:cellulose synthase (UDP-forming)